MSENNEKRLFVALNLPDNIKSDLTKVIEILQNKTPGVKWVKPAGMHITLQFLGNIDEAKEEIIKESLSHLTGKFEEFIFKLDGLDAFPNTKRPRVIIVKCCQEKHNSATALQKSIGQEIFVRAGLKPESRPWRPHIALGRVKKQGWELYTNVNISDSKFMVKTFDLVQSFLKPTGAEYKILKRYNLRPFTK
jgi:2'-5' RNA ligase